MGASEIHGGGGRFPVDDSGFVSGSPKAKRNSPTESEMTGPSGRTHRVRSGGGGSGLALIIGMIVVGALYTAIGGK